MARGTKLFYLLISLFCFAQIVNRVVSSRHHAQHSGRGASHSLFFKRYAPDEEPAVPADLTCESVWDHENKCAFVREYCDPAGLINYFEFYFCSLHSLPALALIIMVFWMIFLFALVGVAASDFFCPNLNTIAKQLRLSESMTGVTFLAFGNASPDIFSTFSAMSAGSGTLAIGEVVGAASFITSVVIGSMAIVKPFKVNKGSFLRDTTFFTGCILFTLYMVLNKKITLAHSIVLTVAYVAYVALVVVSNRRENAAQTQRQQSESENTTTISIVLQDQDDTQKMERGGHQDSDPIPDSPGSATVLLELPRPSPSRTSSLNRCPALVVSHNPGQESVLDHASRLSTDGSQTNYSLSVRHSHHSTASNTHQYPPSPKVQDNEIETGQPETRTRQQKCKDYIRKTLAPIFFPTLQDWHDKTWIGRAMAVVTIPIALVLQLTLPVVDLDAEDTATDDDEHKEVGAIVESSGEKIANGWCRITTMIQMVFAPMFLVAVVSSAAGGGFLYIVGALAVGVVLAGLVGYFSTETKPFRAYEILAFVGFLVAMAWIFLVANEVVGIMQAMGTILKVSDAILGLTVFALGNSLGDLVANVTIAKMGFPTMALSACFGGPLLNMLLGVGVSGIYVNLSTSDPILLEVSSTIIVSLTGVLLTMVIALVVVPRSGYELTRWWGWFLLSVYLACMIVNVVLEIKLPKV